jgi:hypothetical protein
MAALGVEALLSIALAGASELVRGAATRPAVSDIANSPTTARRRRRAMAMADEPQGKGVEQIW